MMKAAIGEMEHGIGKRKDSAYSKSRITVRLAAMLLVFPAILQISGCVGATRAPNTTSQPNQNTPAGAAISVSPSSITFGPVAVNGTASQSVTVSNGGGSDLIVTQASTAASGFAVAGGSFPMTIAAGQQSNLNIVFSPKTVGAVSGTVSVVSNASSSPASVTVSGTAVAATSLLNASPTTLSFGNVTAGAKSTLGVALSNTGSSNVTISSVSLTSPTLSTGGVSAGLVLMPGQSATLDVTFSPTASGNLMGGVTIASNATNSPATIAISGMATQTVSHSVMLAWTASSSVVSGYNVYRSSVSGGPYTKLNTALDTAVSYTDSTVVGGNTYFYVATSVNASGEESADSSEASAAVPTP
jgi:hypothetical protein